MPQIEVSKLTKVFQVPQRETGLRAAIRSLLRRQYKEVRAVEDVSFEVAQGEIVGFLGPNGAGKTTTLKMLAGLLHPSQGTVSIMGHVPWRREPAFLERISMVMGQRSQLHWDLPAMDSFNVNRAVYGVPEAQFRATLDELVALLELGELLKKPVRTLSLGERMKCELAASLLHGPSVLFLDEPTIGVDITMQARIRAFIAEYNRKRGATIILTSHYMADVTALCKRIIVIHNGRLLFDGPLGDLSDRLAPFKLITIDLDRDAAGFDFAALGEVVTNESRKVSVKVPKAQAPATAARVLAELPVLDLTIEDPPIEDVIERVFRGQAGNAEGGN